MFSPISNGMTINVEVTKNGSENNLNLVRRFTKKVQGSGVLPRVRSIRYSARKMSEYVKKKKTLKSLKRREEVTEMIRMGKMPEMGSRGKK